MDLTSYNYNRSMVEYFHSCKSKFIYQQLHLSLYSIRLPLIFLPWTKYLDVHGRRCQHGLLQRTAALNSNLHKRLYACVVVRQIVAINLTAGIIYTVHQLMHGANKQPLRAYILWALRGYIYRRHGASWHEIKRFTVWLQTIFLRNAHTSFDIRIEPTCMTGSDHFISLCLYGRTWSSRILDRDHVSMTTDQWSVILHPSTLILETEFMNLWYKINDPVSTIIDHRFVIIHTSSSILKIWYMAFDPDNWSLIPYWSCIDLNTIRDSEFKINIIDSVYMINNHWTVILNDRDHTLIDIYHAYISWSWIS